VPAGRRNTPDAVVPKSDFSITNELDFAGVGPVAKFGNNIAAIKLLKALEAEGRHATAAEQSVLAKYVGWGGLVQAFRHPSNGKIAAGWEARVAELEDALTADELAAAARSTPNAHYTAANVVSAMWSAVQRLGFDRGRVLEPSVGTGNFFGLMPREARAASALTGVELDSITGRIAKQLYPFHITEVINREASGMAAFRLARAEGMDFNEAVKFAIATINETHFDYSNANRARFMQNGAAKVLLMFRQYSLNMTWHMARMAWNASKGATPEVRRIARRNLAGFLGMAAIFSGTMGLPLFGVTMGILNAIASAFGDPDQPWDAETEFRSFLNDMFGDGTADVIADGAVNKLTGADFASRLSLSQLWFRDPEKELEGAGLYDYWLEQAAGPVGGLIKNTVVGKSMIDQGQAWRGVETMLPKALKDAMKGMRYASEGVNTLRGDPLIKDASLSDALMQTVGFTPADVSKQYGQNAALKNYEQFIQSRRQSLIDAFAMAHRTGDTEAKAAALEQIRAFDKKFPEIAITSKVLHASLVTRARYSAKAEGGIVLSPKLAGRVKADVVGTEDEP
jgi:hypothetical protein